MAASRQAGSHPTCAPAAALLLLAALLSTGCSGVDGEVVQSDDPAFIAERLLGTWRTSAAILDEHAPSGTDHSGMAEFRMTLVRDDAVLDEAPPEQLVLQTLLCGRVHGADKPHLFFFGVHEGRAALLFLSEGFSGPYSDSDGGVVSLRHGGGQPDVLLCYADEPGSPAFAYERVPGDG